MLLTALNAISMDLESAILDNVKLVMCSKQVKQRALSASISALSAAPTTLDHASNAEELATKTLLDSA